MPDAIRDAWTARAEQILAGQPRRGRRASVRGRPEGDFRQTLVDAAKLYGWKYYFTQRSDKSPRDFPDMHLARLASRDYIVAELKSDEGRVKAGQEDWLTAMAAAGVETYVWRPSMIDQIIARLARPVQRG